MTHRINDDLLLVVEKLLKKAGDAIMEVYSGRDFGEMAKADFSPVTRADKLSSQIIGQGLSRLFPGIPVIDEESPVPDYSIRKFWTLLFLLDPLDGTKEFIKKNGEFCINLALLENNIPVVSWIYQPEARKGWTCVRGKGITGFGGSNPLPTHGNTSGVDKLRLITSRSHSSVGGTLFIEKLKTRYDVEIIKMGSALKQVEVALGKSDIYIRGSGCYEWDTAAGQLLVEENQGKVMQWDMASSLLYNKFDLKNPPFIMLSRYCQHSDLLYFIKHSLLSGI